MYSSATKAAQQQQMRRYALCFLLGGVLLTVVLVGLTYSHLLSTPEIQKLQKASAVLAQVQMTQAPLAMVPAGDGAGKDNAAAAAAAGKGQAGESEKKTATHQLTWKSENFQAVPQDVVAAAGKATVVEATLQLTSDSKEVQVHYREGRSAAPPASAPAKRLNVLFLHGSRFNSKIWEDIGTLQFVATMGHRAVAVDLPKGGDTKPQATADFLQKYISEAKLDKPVLVSPSLSGLYSLPYLMLPSAASCTDHVRGFVPIAPSGTARFTADDYNQCKTPTMIVYGEKDTTAAVQTLSQFINSAVYMMKDAGHVCYKDDTLEWHRLLYNFLLTLSSSP